MAKNSFSLQDSWKTILEKEKALAKKVRRLRVSEPIVSTIFIILNCLCFAMGFYAFMVAQYLNKQPNPVKILPVFEKTLTSIVGMNKEPSLGPVVVIFGSIFAIFVVCVVVSLLLRLFVSGKTKCDEKTTLPADRLEALDLIRKKASSVFSMARPEEKNRVIRNTNLLTLLELVVTIALVLIVFDLNHSDLFAIFFMIIFLGAIHWGFSCISFSIIRMAFLHPESADEVGKIADEAEKFYKKEAKERDAEEKRRKREEQINNGIKLFHEGKYDEACKAVKDVLENTSGDVCAINILNDKKLGTTDDGAKKAYKLLWDAKELGFKDEGIRKAVDMTLDLIKPMVYALSEEKMNKAYAQFIDGYYGSVIMTCEPLVEFGHPDAIMLTIVAKVQTLNITSKYPEWLEMVRKAERRGFSEIFAEIAEELTTKLEAAIRYNEEYEKERANRSVESFSSYTSSSGGISSWGEFSGWYDFRTGEPLYRVEGRIVNDKGEEVSAAWWD